MGIEELKKAIAVLVEKVDDEVFLNRIHISLVLAANQEEESD